MKHWFSENFSESDLDSSQGEESGQWTEVERQRQNQNKRKEKKLKIKQRMKDLETKMKHMVGVGPIPMESIEHFEKNSKDQNEAMIKSVKEYLKYYLQFDDTELQEMNFMDTKKAAKDDVIYFALEDQQDIREIYYRKAASGNDDLCVRDYNPSTVPQQIYGTVQEGHRDESF